MIKAPVTSGAKNAGKNNLAKELVTRSAVEYYKLLMNILPNPDPILKKSTSRYNIWEDILADPFVSGLVDARIGASLAYEWELVQNDASDEQLAMYQDNLEDLFNDDLWLHILDAIFKGNNYLEVIWNSNTWLAEKILPKPHRFFQYDADNNLRILYADNNLEGELAPDYKFLVPAYKPSFDNPYGEAIASKSYWHVFFRKNMMNFMAQYAEDFGMPKVTAEVSLALLDRMKVDMGIEDPSTLLSNIDDEIAKLRQNGRLTYLEGVTVSTLSAAGGTSSTSGIYEELIAICNKRDSIAYLGHEGAAMSTAGELGNQNQAQSAAKHLTERSNDLIVTTINKYLEWIHSFHGTGAPPTIRLFEKDDILNYKARAEVDTMLAQNLGVEFTDEYISDRYNVDKKYFVVNKIKVPAGDINKAFEMFAAAKDPYPDQTVLDKFADFLESDAKGSNAMMEKFLKPIFDYAKNSDSLEDMLAGYHELFPELNTDEIFDMVSRITNIAHIHGQQSMQVEEENE